MTGIAVGDRLPDLVLPPLTRHSLALYCGGSGDHHPLHVDSDYARDIAGLPDVIGHGMLTMAWLGRLLTAHWPQDRVRSIETRFGVPTQVGDSLVCRVVCDAVVQVDGERRAMLALEAVAGDRIVATGRAAVAMDG